MAAAIGYEPGFAWRGLVRAVAGHAAWLAVPAAILAGAWWAGGALFSWLGLRDRGPARVALRTVFGLGFLASFHHGLGLTGLFFVPVLALAAAGAVLAGAHSAIREKPWRVYSDIRSWRSHQALVLACVVAVSVLFMLARLPDTHDDPRIYHFAAPEHYLKLHKITSQPGLYSFHIPRAFEMDAVTPWALGGISAAKMVGLIAILACTALVFLASVELGGSGWLAAALLLGVGVLPQLIWQGKNDPMMAAAVAGAVLCVLRAARERFRVPWLAAGAWLLGSAVSVKYNAGFAVGGLVLALFILPRKGIHVRAWPVLAVIGLIPALEWFMESGLYLGNPFNPFLSGLFPQLAWGPFFMDGFHRLTVAMSPPGAGSRWDILAGLWRVLGDPGVGFPVIIFLLPFALGFPRSRRMVYLAVAGLFAYIAWASTERVARYAFALVPLATVMAASTSLFSSFKTRVLARDDLAIAGLVVLSVASNAIITVHLGGWLVLAGQKPPSVFLRERFGSWDAVRVWVNAIVPEKSGVFFTGEARRLWFRPRIVSHHGVMEPIPWKMSRESATPERLRIKMRQAGIDYILDNYLSSAYERLHLWPGLDWDDRQLEVYGGFMRRYARVVYASPRIDQDNGGFYVFRLARQPSAGAAPPVMLPFTEGRWLRSYSLMRAGDMGGAWKAAVRDFAPMREVLQVRYIMATLAERRHSYGEALDLLEPAVRGGLVDNGSWTYYGALLARSGRMDEAVRAFSRAALFQGDRESLVMLGRALKDRGKQRRTGGDAVGAKRDLEAAGYLLGR